MSQPLSQPLMIFGFPTSLRILCGTDSRNAQKDLLPLDTLLLLIENLWIN